MYKSFAALYNLCEGNAYPTSDTKFLKPNSGSYLEEDVYFVRKTPIRTMLYGHPEDLKSDNPYRYDSLDIREDYVPNCTNCNGGNKYEDIPSGSGVWINNEKLPDTPSKGGCTTCSLQLGNPPKCNQTELLPIMNPLFNLREVSKQLILLEDHLFQDRRRCMDCITKHMLTIEGFLEEAITLDTERKYVDDINKFLIDFRKVVEDYNKKNKYNKLDKKDYHNFAQRLRTIRKPLCQKYGMTCYE